MMPTSVASFFNFREQMAGNQDGHAFLPVEVPEHFPNFDDAAWVQAVGRFVEHEQ